MRKNGQKWVLAALILLAAAAAAWLLLRRPPESPSPAQAGTEPTARNEETAEPSAGETEKPDPDPAGASRGVTLLLDGEAFAGGRLEGGAEDDLRVYLTLDGALLADLPFGEKHTVKVILPEGENTVTLTGNAVFMSEADCEGQDCVQMGEVTRDNLEMRVMGGFIVCLPHRVSVEVRQE